MHVPINVKSPNNISEWQMGFNSAFKGLSSEREGGCLPEVRMLVLFRSVFVHCDITSHGKSIERCHSGPSKAKKNASEFYLPC